MQDAATLSRLSDETVVAPGRRWWALVAICIAQLMAVLDLTIMNIALPSLQRDLGFSDSQRQWVVTIYALAFGSLLLLGGRLSDMIGRRRALLIGLGGFTVASLLGAAATDETTLLLARTIQGAFGALLVPSCIALISIIFTDPASRGRAYGILSTIIGAGAGVGLILGGLLINAFDWRAAFALNVPFAAAAGVGLLLTVRPLPGRAGVRVDVPGMILSAAGLGLVVYGTAEAVTAGWTSTSTIGPLLAGLILLVGFVAREQTAAAPLMPLSVLANRGRLAAYLGALANGLGAIPALMSMAIYLQVVHGMSALQAGLAFLPNTVAIIVSGQIIGRQLARRQLRTLTVPGLLFIAAGLGLFSLLTADRGYLLGVLPIMVLIGIGAPLILSPANSAATAHAGEHTGVAGAMVMTSLQIGVSFGTAFVGSLSASSAATFAAAHPTVANLAGQATTHGLARASLFGAITVLVLAAIVFMVAGQVRPIRIDAEHETAPARPADTAQPISAEADRAVPEGESGLAA